MTEAIDGPDPLVEFPLLALDVCEELRILKKRGVGTFEGLDITARLA